MMRDGVEKEKGPSFQFFYVITCAYLHAAIFSNHYTWELMSMVGI